MYLLLFCGNEKAVDFVIIHRVDISSRLCDKVLNNFWASVGWATRIQESIVATHLTDDLDVDELLKLFVIVAVSCFLYELLDRLDLAHDASDHEASELRGSHLSALCSIVESNINVE